jgi:hypothetical protein
MHSIQRRASDFLNGLKLLALCRVPSARGCACPLDSWETEMNRFGSAVIALAILAAPALLPGTAIAQTTMDCSRLYKDFWEKFDREKYARIPAEQLAGVSRMALRAYDACLAGDEVEAKALFDRLHVKLF